MENRIKRYRDKFNYIAECLNDFEKKPQNDLEVKGILYSIQTSIEAIIDVIAMVVKDYGIPVKSDQHNVHELAKLKKIDEESATNLLKANGMRNLIVHRYNGIENDIIFSSIGELKESFIFWTDILEEMVNELDSNDE